MTDESISTHSTNAEQGSASLFHSLPSEIVSEIFLLGTQVLPHEERPRVSFPLLVAAVCKHWHTIAVNTPELWTLIVPPLYTGLHRGFYECFLWMSRWLERSKTMLVSVVLDIFMVTRTYRRSIAIPTEETMIELLNMLSNPKHSRRLRRLDIRTRAIEPINTWMEKMLDSPEDLFPNLEQLTVIGPPWDMAYGRSFSRPQLCWCGLQDLPKLKKLRYQSISPPCVATLTSLTTHGLFTDYLGLKILFSATPHLAHLVMHDFRFWEDRTDQRSEYTPISAPSLRSVAVEVVKPYEYHNVMRLRPSPRDISLYSYSLFAYLVLPNLESLEVRGEFDCSLLFGSALSDNSHNTIKKLRIAEMQHSGENVQLFQSFRALEELELIQTYCSPLLPRSLPDPDSEELVWPHLHSITLETNSRSDLLSCLEFIAMRSAYPRLKIRSLDLPSPSSGLVLGENIRPSGRVAKLTRRMLGKKGGLIEWLSGDLALRLQDARSFGLLDAERVPMAEMC
ncbi:hypothetical protein CPB84DRAFT_1319198 [Gymnopilus junonius]|uniref:F-box domain-containing protein n=1 Tax=Gymnopilus junonius TaxID=109634 RepID=A0A9P5TKI6_GYMJU|nr:hypothetical protein CPB84DRAFT_1319198 [Gymnopilus junonius]